MKLQMIEIFPPALLAKEAKDDVILFLQKLPVPPRTKKEALVAWCNYVGAALTHEMVKALLGDLEGRA